MGRMGVGREHGRSVRGSGWDSAGSEIQRVDRRRRWDCFAARGAGEDREWAVASKWQVLRYVSLADPANRSDSR